MKSRTVKLGKVAVDSGQLIICDPCYIKHFDDSETTGADFAHEIYKHTDGKLWQFTYEAQPASGINKFPGSYMDIISEYGKHPNNLIASGEFKKTKINPRPHIKNGEFSYRGACKTTNSKNQGGQLFLNNSGVVGGVVFSSGLGDGIYTVMAELITYPDFGERISMIWIKLIEDYEE